MPEIEDQLRSWADAAASPEVTAPSEVVAPLDATWPLHGRAEAHRRGRWPMVLGAAAAVLAVVAVAVSLRGPSRSEPVIAGSRSSTTAPDPSAPTAPGDGSVPVRLLHVGLAGDEPMNTIRTAMTDEQLDGLWSALIQLEEPTGEAEPVGPPPEVDLDAEFVASFTIPDDACPPTLERLVLRDGLLTPDFVEVADVCPEPLVPKRYVVAVAWADIEAGARLHLPAQDPYDAPEAFLLVRPGQRAPVHAEVEFRDGSVTLPAGGELEATIVVTNTTGEPQPGTICGEPFALYLENDSARQDIVRPACAMTFELPAGTTTYEARLSASHTTCTTDPRSSGRACLPDGTPPPLPVGRYDVVLFMPAGLTVAMAPTTVEVVEP